MNKKAKVFLIVFFSALFALIVAGFFVAGQIESKSNPYSLVDVDDGWIINKTQIDINVNKDRTAFVVEKYEVNFLEPSYSMYRALPLTQNERYFGIKGSCEERSTTVSTETGFFSDAGNKFLFVYIDMPSRQTGVFNFEISYKIIPGTQRSNTNRFYMNLVGHGWTTDQTSVSITAKFPANINVDQSIVYMGSWGDTSQIPSSELAISGDTLTISDVGLLPFEGITADLYFPKKTFGVYFDFNVLIALMVGLILLLIAYFVKNTFAKNDPIVPVVNFYPPKDENGRELSPVDVGFLIDNNTEPSDVTSMIYYFASKGYLRIEQEQNDQITIVKVSDLPQGVQNYEATIFNAIFSKGATATVATMQKSFPMAVSSVTNAVKNKYGHRIFEKSNKSFSFAGFIAVLIAMAIYLTAASFRVYGQLSMLSLFMVIPVALVIGVGTYICTHYHKFNERKRFWMFIGYGAIAAVLAVFVAAIIGGAAMSFLERGIFISLLMASAMIVPFFAKRTEYYNKRLGDIIGFKHFLETTEKDRLEKLLDSNPNFYYDILPYANVLGVSEIWSEKFAKLQVAPPTYYSSSSNVVFNIVVFNSVFRSSTSSIAKSVAAAHRGSGVKGLGGGGGSRGGGGFGGGGGGRR